MKFLFFFLTVCLAAASCSFLSGETVQQKPATKEFLVRQKNIFRLLNHVNMKNTHEDQVMIGNSFNIHANLEKFNNVLAVKEFLNFYSHGMLPKHKIFSIAYQRLRDEAVSLFHLFFFAKDFDTFYRCACWARMHMNEGMFVYALTVAVMHRNDCRGIVLPAPYEIYPFFFLNTEVIQKGHRVKMQGKIMDTKLADFYGVHQVDKTFFFNSNYTGWYTKTNDETAISYFTEDVGLNSYYFYFHADYPFWMHGDVYGLNNDRRGEIFYYFYQQLMARYYMERLSNGLGEIPRFSWNWPIKTGFMSNLRFANGLDFPSRPNFFNMKTEKNLYRFMGVEDCERRIRDAVRSGFVLNEDGSFVSIKHGEDINVFGNIVQGNGDSPNHRFYRYMGLIAKGLLGNTDKTTHKHFVRPAVLEQYETALRDPMFYQLYSRYMHYFFMFKDTLTPYTQEEFFFPGVKIENVLVDKLVTYFDEFYVDMTNAMYRNGEEMNKDHDDFTFVATQHRLNHKPFDVRIDVTSDKATDVIVRMFMGPKYDSFGKKIDINNNRYNFFEVDSFFHKMEIGKKTIVRNSRDFAFTRKDRTPARTLMQTFENCLKGNEEFMMDMTEGHNLFPDRLLLPRGKTGGMMFQFYVIISPYHQTKTAFGKGFDARISAGVGTGARFMDNRALGFPFDRFINENFFFTDNMFFTDVVIYHRYGKDINKTFMDEKNFMTTNEKTFMGDRNTMNGATGTLSSTSVNMKFVFFFLVVCVAAGSCGFLSGQNLQKPASKEFLLRQKNVLRLFYHVNMKNAFLDQVNIGRSFNIRANLDKFNNVDVVKKFLYYYQFGMLPRHKIFSISYENLRHEAIALFNVFFFAKDFDTFYRCACWAREYMNEGMFVYTLRMAVMHRHDCKGMILPAHYEVYPHFFLNSEVIQKGQRLKMQGKVMDDKLADYYGVHQVDKTFFIQSNYSGWYMKTNDETAISYFTEDVGLNSLYYNYHIDYPFWMYGDIYGLNKDRRGEIYYYFHQQLLARYYMERLSNGLGEIPRFSWHWPIKTGFMSNLHYANGLSLPSRPNYVSLFTEKNLYRFMDVEDCERRIRDVIQSGFVLNVGLSTADGGRVDIRKHDGINILGNIIQGNGDSPFYRFYRYMPLIAKRLLGNIDLTMDKHFVRPAALENFETALRDPMFYQLYNRYLHYFFMYKNTLPSYTHEEFVFPGVKIEDIVVDKLVTYFDLFDIDMTNSVYRNGDEINMNKDNFLFVGRQHRLNHKAFDVKIDVVSDKATDVIVRMFLGPKFDSMGKRININDNRFNFFEIDTFLHKLDVGKKTIVRNSREFLLSRRERTPMRKIMKYVDDSIVGDKEFNLDMSEGHNLFPDNLLLPRGKEGGMSYQLYVIISPHKLTKVGLGTGFDMRLSAGVGTGARFMDDRALGFPFDRIINEHDFYTPNMYMKDVFIFHKSMKDLNKSYVDIDATYKTDKDYLYREDYVDNLDDKILIDGKIIGDRKYDGFYDKNLGFLDTIHTGYVDKKY
ncbi:uncharacterized protein LOC143917289 [Arctopsyche grandis]|uniref:uncharacterized protein LOC143917289 n=1 Tax=Arctopsyche grandis TaxID=121162 RepID=UPI00406D9BE0